MRQKLANISGIEYLNNEMITACNRRVPMYCMQLSSSGRRDVQLADLRISYRTRVYSDIQQDITHAYAVDIVYRHPNSDFVVSISTDVDTARSSDSFSVTVNGLVMTDPVRRPLLTEELLIKQMTNFIIVVSSPDFRLEFDVASRIYVRLDPRFENKVRRGYAESICLGLREGAVSPADRQA